MNKTAKSVGVGGEVKRRFVRGAGCGVRWNGRDAKMEVMTKCARLRGQRERNIQKNWVVTHCKQRTSPAIKLILSCTSAFQHSFQVNSPHT